MTALGAELGAELGAGAPRVQTDGPHPRSCEDEPRGAGEVWVPGEEPTTQAGSRSRALARALEAGSR